MGFTQTTAIEVKQIKGKGQGLRITIAKLGYMESLIS